MNPEQNIQTPPPEKPVVGYCRACGKALHEDTVRPAMGTLYCAEHVPGAAAAPPPPPSAGPDPYPSPYATPPPPGRADISPGLAFLLGLIPGVGAIYNAQYGKGLIHALITGALLSIGDNSGAEALFVMLTLAFWFYMPFEAYHTARKRQAGEPVNEFSSILAIEGPTAAVGPVILIAIGVLFLLNNLEVLNMRAVLRWWPVGLIALGVYLLVVRLAGQGNGGEARNANQ